VLYIGAGSLIAAQVLGLVGLLRPGYEVLCALAMLLLALPALLMAVSLALTI
jgi:hypothetical protein